MYTTILLIPLSGASMPRPRLLEVTLLLQLLLKLVSLSSSWPLVPSSCLSSCSFPWHIARHAAYGTTILLIKILLIKILLPVAIFQSFQYNSEFLKMFEDITNMNEKTWKNLLRCIGEKMAVVIQITTYVFLHFMEYIMLCNFHD